MDGRQKAQKTQKRGDGGGRFVGSHCRSEQTMLVPADGENAIVDLKQGDEETDKGIEAYRRS
jgi:hypothetical protein